MCELFFYVFFERYFLETSDGIFLRLKNISARLLASKLLATEVISGIADVEQRVECR